MHYIWIWIEPIGENRLGLYLTHGEDLQETLDNHPELPQREPDRIYSRDHAPSEEEWEQVVVSTNRVFKEWVQMVREKGKEKDEEIKRNPFRFI